MVSNQPVHCCSVVGMFWGACHRFATPNGLSLTRTHCRMIIRCDGRTSGIGISIICGRSRIETSQTKHCHQEDSHCQRVRELLGFVKDAHFAADPSSGGEFFGKRMLHCKKKQWVIPEHSKEQTVLARRFLPTQIVSR